MGFKNLIEPDHVFFELTKEEKIARVANIGCDYFIDDLPEILLMPGFPKKKLSAFYLIQTASTIPMRYMKALDPGRKYSLFSRQHGEPAIKIIHN